MATIFDEALDETASPASVSGDAAPTVFHEAVAPKNTVFHEALAEPKQTVFHEAVKPSIPEFDPSATPPAGVVPISGAAPVVVQHVPMPGYDKRVTSAVGDKLPDQPTVNQNLTGAPPVHPPGRTEAQAMEQAGRKVNVNLPGDIRYAGTQVIQTSTGDSRAPTIIGRLDDPQNIKPIIPFSPEQRAEIQQRSQQHIAQHGDIQVARNAQAFEQYLGSMPRVDVNAPEQPQENGQIDTQGKAYQAQQLNRFVQANPPPLHLLQGMPPQQAAEFQNRLHQNLAPVGGLKYTPQETLGAEWGKLPGRIKAGAGFLLDLLGNQQHEEDLIPNLQNPDRPNEQMQKVQAASDELRNQARKTFDKFNGTPADFGGKLIELGSGTAPFFIPVIGPALGGLDIAGQAQIAAEDAMKAQGVDPKDIHSRALLTAAAKGAWGALTAYVGLGGKGLKGVGAAGATGAAIEAGSEAIGHVGYGEPIDPAKIMEAGATMGLMHAVFHPQETGEGLIEAGKKGVEAIREKLRGKPEEGGATPSEAEMKAAEFQPKPEQPKPGPTAEDRAATEEENRLVEKKLTAQKAQKAMEELNQEQQQTDLENEEAERRIRMSQPTVFHEAVAGEKHAVQKLGSGGEVSRDAGQGSNLPESGEGVRRGEQGNAPAASGGRSEATAENGGEKASQSPEAPETSAAGVKEPWQMTKQEYREALGLKPAVKFLDTNEVAVGDAGDIHATVYDKNYGGKPREFQPGWVDPTGKWVGWDARDSRHTWNKLDQEHDAQVTTAFAEGKPVPANVLKDYPELQKLAQQKKGSNESATPNGPEVRGDNSQTQAGGQEENAVREKQETQGPQATPASDANDAGVLDLRRAPMSELRQYAKDKGIRDIPSTRSGIIAALQNQPVVETPIRPKATDTITARRQQLADQIRDMIVNESGQTELSSTHPQAMRVGRGEANVGSLISPESAIAAAEKLPEGHPAKLILHNLRELEKNPRGTKFVKVNTNDVPDGTRVVMNDSSKPLTVERQQGEVVDDIRGEIPEGGMELYGKKVLPPVGEPQSAARPNTGIFGQPEYTKNTGEQQPLFHEPKQAEPIARSAEDQRIANKFKAGEKATPNMFEGKAATEKLPPTEQAEVRPTTTKTDPLVPAFRKHAEILEKQAEDRHRDMTQNPTPKRMRQYNQRRTEGDLLKRVGRAFEAMADARENGTLPKELESVKTKAEVTELVKKKTKTNGGYYDAYYELHEYEKSTPAAKALQDLIEPRSAEQKAQAAKAAEVRRISDLEQKVQFSPIEGFFPTPKPLAERMVQEADIGAGDKVLEPSAGKGDILDAIKAEHLDAKTKGIEYNPTLAEIARAKGHDVTEGDFLKSTEKQDRIVMNPPFERGQDIEHVRHAFDLLNPGGKVVSVMSEGPFFRSDKKATEFRDWLESVGGTSEKLPEGSFAGKDSFRQTGTAARLVTIEKPTAVGKVQPELGKAPWQMTKDEFAAAREAVDVNAMRPYIAFDKRTQTNSLSPDAPPNVRSMWDVNNAGSNHERIVEKAMEEGKQISPKVLADYPKLAGTDIRHTAEPLKKGDAVTFPDPADPQSKLSGTIDRISKEGGKAVVIDGTGDKRIFSTKGMSRSGMALNPAAAAQQAGKAALEAGKTTVAELRHLRERYSIIERRDSPELAHAFVLNQQAGAQAQSTVRAFIRKSFGNDKSALQDFLRLGYHYRGEIFDAQGQAATGIPRLTPAEQTRIESDPVVKKAIATWNKEIAPTLQDIRTRNNMPMSKKASGVPFFLNLPSEFDPTSPDRSAVNVGKAFDKPASGEGSYLNDPEEALSAILRGHLRTDAAAKLKDSIRDISIDKNSVVDPTKTRDPAQFESAKRGQPFTAQYKGHTEKVAVVDLNKDRTDGQWITNANGDREKWYPPEYHYVPERVAQAFDKLRQSDDVHDTIADKAMHGATRLGLIGDFAPHGLRELHQVASRMGQSGQSAFSLAPWIGSLPAAIHRMTQMSETPYGEVMQTLLDRSGSNRGSGLNLKEPTNAVTKVLDLPHKALMGPESGIDPMARRAVADAHLRMEVGNRYMDAIEQDLNDGTITPADASNRIEQALGAKETLALGRRVNNTLGYSNRQTRAEALNWAQRIFPFLSSESGMIPDEIRKVLTLNLNPTSIIKNVRRGEYGRALLQAGTQLATGPVGTILMMQAMNYAFTALGRGKGQPMDDNDEGHKLDVEIRPGWYISNLDPTFNRATRLLGIRAAANKQPGSTSGEIGKEAVNETLSTLNPAIRLGFTAATGDNPYLANGKQLMGAKKGWYWPLGIGRNTVQAMSSGQPVGPAMVQDAASLLTGLRVAKSSGKNYTDAERLAHQILLKDVSGRDMTPEDRARRDGRRELVNQLRENPHQKGLIDQAVKNGVIPHSQINEVQKEAKQPELANLLKSMEADEAVKVWDKANPAEKKVLREPVMEKIIRSQKLDANEQDKLLAHAGIEPPIDLGVNRELHTLNKKVGDWNKVKREAMSLARQAEASPTPEAADYLKQKARKMLLDARPSDDDTERQKRLDLIHKAIERVRERVKEQSLDSDSGDDLIKKLVGLADKRKQAA